MNLFQHEDALILGMLFSNKIRSLLELNPDILPNGWYNYTQESGPSGTGRGGYYYDPCGDDGKIPTVDAKTGGSSLAGKGATPTHGGQGMRTGTLGEGGSAPDGTPLSSAGGGAGVYGGGSSFTRGGGGGGSSSCPAAYIAGGLDDPLFNKRFNKTLYDLENEPEPLHHFLAGVEITDDNKYRPPYNQSNVYQYNKALRHDKPFKKGYDSVTLETELEGLIELNTGFPSYYSYNHSSKMGDYYSWDTYLEIFNKANGNGFILISKPNERIKFKHLKIEVIENMIDYVAQSGIPVVGSIGKFVKRLLRIGELQGIGQIIFKEGLSEQEITLAPATYEVLLYGASGGNTGNWSPIDDSYTGGFGGFQLCVIDVQNEPVTLYAVVGHRGSGIVGSKAFNGGGSCSVGCTGGGGATDLRWSPMSNENTLRSRIAVAGGGGGIFGSSYGGSPDKDPEYWNNKKISPNGEFGEGTKVLFTDRYRVNDQSIVRVEFDTITSEDDGPATFDLTINIDDGKEGTLTKTVTVESGHQVVNFDLSEVYPVDTPTHLVTIECSLTRKEPASSEEELPYLGVTSDFNVYIDTKYKDNESIDVPRKPIILNCIDKIDLKDASEYILKHFENLSMSGTDDININDIEDIIKKQSGPTGGSIEVKDLLNLGEIAEVIKKSVNKLSIDALDSIEMSDSLDATQFYIINISIDEETPFGTVSGAGSYTLNSEVTLTATPFIDYTVEWYKDNILISKDNSIDIIVTGSESYIVKFIPGGTSDNPYITEGLTDSFDFILNRGIDKEHTNKSVLWINLFYTYPTFDIDSRGFITDGEYSKYDSLLNNRVSFDIKAILWRDLLGTDDTVDTNIFGYASQGLTDCFDAIINGSSGHDESTDSWNNKG